MIKIVCIFIFLKQKKKHIIRFFVLLIKMLNDSFMS